MIARRRSILFPLSFFAIVALLPWLPLGCSGHGRVSWSDQINIYVAVLQDFTALGDKIHASTHALLDPAVLIPVDRRIGSEGRSAPLHHPQTIVDSLLARRVIAGICEPAEVQGHATCRGDLPGPEIALSAIQEVGTDTVAVSALRNAVCTSRDRLCIGFAVEYRYTLVRRGGVWLAATKTQTMIT